MGEPIWLKGSKKVAGPKKPDPCVRFTEHVKFFCPVVDVVSLIRDRSEQPWIQLLLADLSLRTCFPFQLFIETLKSWRFFLEKSEAVD